MVRRGILRACAPALCLGAVLAWSVAGAAVAAIWTPTGEIPNPGANNVKNFGYSVVDGADLDGDQVNDFILCGYYEGNAGQNKQGACWAISGADFTELLDFGNPAPQSYNVSASYLNVDGDHGIDILFGDCLKENGRNPAVGAVNVALLGPNHKGVFSVIGTQTLESPIQAAGVQFGRSIAAFGGTEPRVVIGAPGVNKAFVYAVLGGQLVAAGPPLEGATGSEFGYAVAAAGKALIVGAPGSSQIYRFPLEGGSFGPGTALTSSADRFGEVVVAVGEDVVAVGTNDGIDDVSVGRVDLLDVATLAGILPAPIPGNRVADIGYWDCDDHRDILVGGSSFDAFGRLYYGAPLLIHSGVDGTVLGTVDFAGAATADGFGYSFAVGGAGLDTIVAGAPGSLDRRGHAYYFIGRPVQVDSDHDGVPDECDLCQGHPDGEDPDGDGSSWPCDPCPDDPLDTCLDDLSVTIDVDPGAHILENGTEIPAATTLTNEPDGGAGDVQVVNPTCTGLAYSFYRCDDPFQTLLPPLYRLGPALGKDSVIDLVTGDSTATTCDVLDYLHPETIAALTSNGAAVTLCGTVCYSSYAPFECLDEDAAGEPVPCFDNLWQGGTFCDEFVVELVHPLVVWMEVKPSGDFDPDVIPTINLGLNGNVPLVILGKADFDVRQVDPYSVYLEAGSILRGTNGGDQYSYADKNGDGFEDLILHMDIEAYQPGDLVTVTLYGRTYPPASLYIVGHDGVRILDK